MKKFRGIFIKNEHEIGLLSEANRIVSLVLDELGKMVAPGRKTIEFENKALDLCNQFNVAPAFKGYHGFPYAVCCSVNEEVVHGFPSERILQEGDIVSFDFGVKYQGFFGDSARTYAVGEVDSQALRLMDVTRESLYKGIAEAVPGNDLYDISRAVQAHVDQFGFGVVKRFVGHGIGRNLHEKPEVPNFAPKRKEPIPLKKGMVIAIEPMITMGDDEVEILKDKWTAVTKDRSLAAHFEHTVAITADGPRILSVSGS